MDVKKAMSQAKRKQTMKMIGIAIVTVLVLVPIMYKGMNYLSGKQATKAKEAITLLHTIGEPNISIDAHHIQNNSTWSGNIVTKRYKEVEGYIVPWGTLESSYNWRNMSIDFDSIMNGWYTTGDANYSYDKNTKQKVAKFYHPQIETYDDGIVNDIAAVATLDNYVAEMAISFDDVYPLEDVLRQLPAQVHVQWVYVDSPVKENGRMIKEQMGPNSNDIYGFTFEEDVQVAYNTFQKAIREQLERTEEPDDAMKRIDQSKKIETRGLMITGKASDMKLLEEIPFIRGASVGVVVEMKPYMN